MVCFLIAALLYPSVVKTDANLFDAAGWKSQADAADGKTHERGMKRGGPFSSDEPVWTAKTTVPRSCFWRQDVEVKPGRRYLVGAWFRRDKARALVWCFGRMKNGKPFDRRMYLTGGFNNCLARYLRPEIKRRFGGDTEVWNLLYRPIEIEGEMARPVQFKFGIYMSTGEVEIAHPFLVDITDKGRIPLMVGLHGGKPVKRMSLVHVGIGDEVWRKSFAEHVPVFSGAIEFSDALRGFDGANRIDGNMLTVTYADGSAENVYAPQENAFLSY